MKKTAIPAEDAAVNSPGPAAAARSGAAGENSCAAKTGGIAVQERLQHLQEQLKKQSIEAILITSPANRYYLSGFDGSHEMCIRDRSRRLLMSWSPRSGVLSSFTSTMWSTAARR